MKFLAQTPLKTGNHCSVPQEPLDHGLRPEPGDSLIMIPLPSLSYDLREPGLRHEYTDLANDLMPLNLILNL